MQTKHCKGFQDLGINSLALMYGPISGATASERWNAGFNQSRSCTFTTWKTRHYPAFNNAGRIPNHKRPAGLFERGGRQLNGPRWGAASQGSKAPAFLYYAGFPTPIPAEGAGLRRLVQR